MLRSFFISLSKAKWMQRMMSRWQLARRVSSRFVAGEQIEDAIRAVRSLNQSGVNATLDFLGEHTFSTRDADAATGEVLGILDEVNRSGIAANVSIKLSQFGMAINPEVCQENLGKILSHARNLDNFIRIDMEDSSMTAATIDTYLEERQKFENLGIVIQAYLYRSAQDIERIIQVGGKVRLCKGAYQEPAAIAFPLKKDVDANYDTLASRLLEISLQQEAPLLHESGRIPPVAAFATHDPLRIKNIINRAKAMGIPLRSFEFQMLYGIRRDLQDELVKSGFPVRVYVPYGTQWYPYFMRRLAERPANVWFFVSNLMHK